MFEIFKLEGWEEDTSILAYKILKLIHMSEYQRIKQQQNSSKKLRSLKM